MATNQEFRHWSEKEKHNPGGQATALEADHMLGYEAQASVTTGTFNERRLKWLNTQPGGPFTSLPQAMQAFAESQGATNWSSYGGTIT